MGKVEMYFHVVEWDVDHVAIGFFNQPEIYEPGNVGVDVGVIASSGFG